MRALCVIVLAMPEPYWAVELCVRTVCSGRQAFTGPGFSSLLGISSVSSANLVGISRVGLAFTRSQQLQTSVTASSEVPHSQP
jgi:hypothetical protein